MNVNSLYEFQIEIVWCICNTFYCVLASKQLDIIFPICLQMVDVISFDYKQYREPYTVSSVVDVKSASSFIFFFAFPVTAHMETEENAPTSLLVLCR